MPSDDAQAAPAALARRHGSGFWSVAFAFLIVMAFATLPSPLYGLYRTRDHLSAFTVTVVYAIFAGGTIAALLRVDSIAARVGRRGVMLAAVVTMMAAAALLAAWKDLPGLLAGRLLTGVSVGLAAGTAIPYLIELGVRKDPNAPVARARNHRHVSERRRTWNRAAGCRLPGAVGEAAVDLALPPLRRARSDRSGRFGGRARNGRAGFLRRRRSVRRLVRHPRPGFQFPRPRRPSQPSPRTDCSPACPGSSSPPRSTIPHTHWPAQRCSWCSPQA